MDSCAPGEKYPRGLPHKRIIMTEPRIHPRVIRNRKKNPVPLSKLRTSDAVKTVVDHPRRLEELLRMLEDKDRGVRGRAAATIAKLSESHPRTRWPMTRPTYGGILSMFWVFWVHSFHPGLRIA
jgi:hypothetical protein